MDIDFYNKYVSQISVMHPEANWAHTDSRNLKECLPYLCSKSQDYEEYSLLLSKGSRFGQLIIKLSYQSVSLISLIKPLKNMKYLGISLTKYS